MNNQQAARKHEIDADALKTMHERGGRWYAYENQDFGSSSFGHLRFLKAGEGCTFVEAPTRHPDTAQCLGWRYVLIGEVNTTTGEITHGA